MKKKQLLYGTTALAAAGFLMAATAGCAQAPAKAAPEEPAKTEEPIRLELSGFLGESFSLDPGAPSE